MGGRAVDAPALLGATDLSGFFQGEQDLSEPVIVDPELRAQLGPGKRSALMEEVDEFPLEGHLRRFGSHPVLDLEVTGAAVSEACQTKDQRTIGSGARADRCSKVQDRIGSLDNRPSEVKRFSISEGGGGGARTGSYPGVGPRFRFHASLKRKFRRPPGGFRT